MIDEQEILEIINKKVETDVEYKPTLPTAKIIAKILASFANTNGGYLILGVKSKKTKNQIVGLSSDFYITETITKALVFLDLKVNILEHKLVYISNKKLYVFKLRSSETEVLLDSKKFIRENSKTIEVHEDKDKPIEKISIKEYSKTYAIIIAIENYQPKDSNQIPSVKYAENDINMFKEVLINKMGVQEEDITLFLNDNALKNNLEYDLFGLFNILTENDRLIFYYVGHGFHDGVTNYLTTYDTHPLHISDTAVSLRKVFLDPFLKSKCKHGLIFIDACATSLQKEDARNILSNIDYNDFHFEKNENFYLATFFSCQAGQSSYSCNHLSHGIWTFHLINGISGNIPSIIKNKKIITDRSLVDYLGSEVSKYVRDNLGYEQNPKAILESDSQFIIAKVN